MMRAFLLFFWCLVIHALLTAGKAALAEQALIQGLPWPAQIDGFLLADPANNQAKPADLNKVRILTLDIAQEKISTYLKNLDPPLKYWKPSLPFIKDNLVESSCQGPDRLEGSNRFISWKLTLKPPDLEKFRQLDREAYRKWEIQARDDRRHARLGLAARTLACLLAILGGGVAMLRLDDRQSKFRTLFRLTLAGLVAGVIAGLWWLS